MTSNGRCPGGLALMADGCLRLEQLSMEDARSRRGRLAESMRYREILPKSLAAFEVRMVAGHVGEAPLSAEDCITARGFAALAAEELGLHRVARAEAVVELYIEQLEARDRGKPV